VTFLWNGDPTDETKGLLVEDANDVGYIAELVDYLVAEYGVDPARVYLTGASNGGLMTERMACERPDVFAAVAPVMITLPEGFPAWCTSTTPVPMLMILGVDDPFFPWQGGLVEQGPTSTQRYLSASETVDFWVTRNNAATEPAIEALPDLDPNDGTRVFRETHVGGESGTDFIFYRVEGGGHTWPGSRLSLLESLAGVGRVSQDIDASRVIWDFFKSKSRPAEANS
jgi:polyhydroxybutyrate depolymerase